MFSQTIIVLAKFGSARNLDRFIEKARSFEGSEILVEKTGVARRANAKSLLGMMSLGIVPGDEVKIIASGGQEKKIITELIAMMIN